MSRTLASRKQDTKIIQRLAEIEEHINQLRGNQVAKIVLVDITLDGLYPATKGRIYIGATGANQIYLESRTAGGVDFYNYAGTKIASLDTSGNLRCLGTITQNVAP